MMPMFRKLERFMSEENSGYLMFGIVIVWQLRLESMSQDRTNSNRKANDESSLMDVEREMFATPTRISIEIFLE
jgi:hypothetical protein